MRENFTLGDIRESPASDRLTYGLIRPRLGVWRNSWREIWMRKIQYALDARLEAEDKTE
jgi:hypothetical protein